VERIASLIIEDPKTTSCCCQSIQFISNHERFLLRERNRWLSLLPTYSYIVQSVFIFEHEKWLLFCHYLNNYLSSRFLGSKEHIM
jgi:hypothetical protein